MVGDEFGYSKGIWKLLHVSTLPRDLIKEKAKYQVEGLIINQTYSTQEAHHLQNPTCRFGT